MRSERQSRCWGFATLPDHYARRGSPEERFGIMSVCGRPPLRGPPLYREILIAVDNSVHGRLVGRVGEEAGGSRGCGNGLWRGGGGGSGGSDGGYKDWVSNEMGPRGKETVQASITVVVVVVMMKVAGD
ncbi:hypothetical protein E2C01_032802 [Portunus trituberculatus]|uniref:Uncharacterized protein n=1 Tax=Portunus trituberculatus TaxID=210409 RepID=A0A5B7EWV1_PORTR|nr:hypothetical protein [Portunus trituberculatus]